MRTVDAFTFRDGPTRGMDFHDSESRQFSRCIRMRTPKKLRAETVKHEHVLSFSINGVTGASFWEKSRYDHGSAKRVLTYVFAKILALFLFPDGTAGMLGELVLNDIIVSRYQRDASLSLTPVRRPLVFSREPAFCLTYTYYCITSCSSIIPACAEASGEMMRGAEKKVGEGDAFSFFT